MNQTSTQSPSPDHPVLLLLGSEGRQASEASDCMLVWLSWWELHQPSGVVDRSSAIRVQVTRLPGARCCSLHCSSLCWLVNPPLAVQGEAAPELLAKICCSCHICWWRSCSWQAQVSWTSCVPSMAGHHGTAKPSRARQKHQARWSRAKITWTYGSDWFRLTNITCNGVAHGEWKIM